MSKYYDHDFKQYIAKLAVDEKIPQTDLGREYGLETSTIDRWVRKYRQEKAEKKEEVGYVTPTEHKEREKELLSQIKELEEENVILKKAANVLMKPCK